MRRLFAITAVILVIAASACLAQTSGQRNEPPRRSGDENWRQYFAGSSRDLFRIGDTFFGAPIFLRWPDKRITLDVKDSGITEVAATLQEQTGIEFIIGDGVPSDLKITVHVTGMRIRDFLDTLTSTTGMVYVPENSENEDQSDVTAEPEAAETPKLTVPTRNGRVEISKPQLVTRVTILNPRAEGVVVNMGKVSVSLKNADPIKAVSNLVNQIKGASYVVMELDDYLALQSPDQAAQIKKALVKASRPKVTLELRNAEVSDALTQLSKAGNFYITIPKPGSPSFLVIPDVKIAKADALPSPSIEYWSTDVREAREQAICVQYTKQMLTAVLAYAKENGGVLPNATKWVELVPVKNDYLESRMPGGRYQYSYGMNANLSGVKLSSIKKPSQTVLIFECDGYHGAGTEKDIIRTQRHPGGIVYGFADGSVKILTEKPNFKP